MTEVCAPACACVCVCVCVRQTCELQRVCVCPRAPLGVFCMSYVLVCLRVLSCMYGCTGCVCIHVSCACVLVAAEVGVGWWKGCLTIS